MSTKSGADIGFPTSDFRLPTSDFRLFAVNIDNARPQGSTGMVDAILALTYDPKVFDVSAADVRLGTVPAGGNGWQLNTEVNAQTGLIGVELYSNTPIQSSAGGSLVTIAMHLRGEPGSSGPGPALTTGLTLVPDVDPAGGVRVYQTSVSDAQGEFVLHTAVDGGQTILDGAQWTVDGGQNGSEILQDVAQTANLPNPAANNCPPSTIHGPLPLAVVERVFGDPAQTAANCLLPTAYFLDQPGPLLSSEPADTTPGAGRDTDLPLAPADGAQPDWVADNYLASLGHAAGIDLVWWDESCQSDRKLRVELR